MQTTLPALTVGQVWRLGPHVLAIADVHDAAGGWQVWKEWLKEGMTFCPYYGPHLPLTRRADQAPLLLVHPEPHVAAQAIELYATVHGASSAKLLVDGA